MTDIEAAYADELRRVIIRAKRQWDLSCHQPGCTFTVTPANGRSEKLHLAALLVVRCHQRAVHGIDFTFIDPMAMARVAPAMVVDRGDGRVLVAGKHHRVGVPVAKWAEGLAREADPMRETAGSTRGGSG